VYTPRELRIQRLAADIAASRNKVQSLEFRAKAEKIADRDEYEAGKIYGQNVRETYEKSDFFVDASDSKSLNEQLSRVVQLIFRHPFITPTRHENGMFAAYASALRSAALGRQVGAAVAAENGDVLVTGVNEVPSFGGGQYWEGDEVDAREFHGKTDSSDEAKKRVFADVVEQLSDHGLIDRKLVESLEESILDNVSNGRLAKPYQLSHVRELTEFAREVHAEMSALMQAARYGINISGKVMYTTTFPCHHCTRHIIAAGIRKVIYVSSYPKSLAFELHKDSIILDNGTTINDKVMFESFVGVSANKYVELFRGRERKSEGNVVDPVKSMRSNNSIHRTEESAYLVREGVAYETVRAVMQDKGLLDRQLELGSDKNDSG
jgi:cytidine deaminase